MTRFPQPAARWCILFLALCFLQLSSPTERRGSAALADPLDPPPAAATTPTITGLPTDLQALSREELIELVRTLTLQNQILAQRLAEQQQALAEAAPDLQARIDYQARTIERLQSKLARTEAAAEQAAAEAQAAVTAAAADLDEPSAAAPDDATAPDAPASPEVDTDPLWEYRFAYEYGLIRVGGTGRVILRDENGKRQRHEYDYSEFRRDAIWANLLIRNDSEQPMRFTGLIELQGDAPFGGGNRERLAVHGFRTPLLEPGEVFQIAGDELAVDRPWKVDVLELTEVQAFATPADPDPDPGNR